jgi:hypothetical protein
VIHELTSQRCPVRIFSGSTGSRNVDGQVTQDSETYAGSCAGPEGSENAKWHHFCGCVQQGRRVPGQGDGLPGASGRACLLPESGVLGLRSAVALLRMPSDVWSGRPVVLVDDAAEDVATSDGLATDHRKRIPLRPRHGLSQTRRRRTVCGFVSGRTCS